MPFHSLPDSYTKLLIHSDHVNNSTSIVDSSASSHTITLAGNVKHSTAQSKFGKSSLYFDGSGDELSIPDSADWDWGSGDWTVDCWLHTSPSAGTRVFSKQGDSYYQIYCRSAGEIEVHYDGGNSLVMSSLTGGDLPPSNTWFHYAYVKHGDTVKFYIDGVEKGSDTVSGSHRTESVALNIGAYTGGIQSYTGYMDEIRFSKGIARWVSDFIPPNKPYSVMDDDFVTDIAGIEDEANVTTVSKDLVIKSDPDASGTDSIFTVSKKDGATIMEIQENSTILYGDKDNNPGISIVQQRIYKLQSGSVTDVTIDPLQLDNNAVYEMIYVAHHYDPTSGNSTAGWRYLRWHAFDGSGGSGDNAGANWYVSLVENSGTGESTDVPVWTVSGGNARLTYGAGYMNYRNLIIKSLVGSPGFRDV